MSYLKYYSYGVLFAVICIAALFAVVAVLPDFEATPQEDHIQTVADFHEVMHRAKMHHSHPMPMSKPPRGARL